jgi:hypothetical protein
MHNKLMVMDNAVAIVGGRNMSDPYFEVHPEFNFRDLGHRRGRPGGARPLFRIRPFLERPLVGSDSGARGPARTPRRTCRRH